MLKYIWFLIFINFLKCTPIKTNLAECNSVIIEGGEQALRKIFNDFNEIKTIVNDLKSIYVDSEQGNNTLQKKDLPLFDVRFDQVAKRCETISQPKDCATATACTKRSGIYKIQIAQYNNETVLVACDEDTQNGDWLVIQKRQDGSVDFYRDWMEYEEGFGDIDGEFFIGLKKLYALTNYNGPQELLIVMEDVKSNKTFAKYDAFAISNATESYKLKKLGKYSGTAGDSLQHHIGMKFSTKDRDNDMNSSSCAESYTGAWWYNNCHLSNLNGKYGDNTYSKGINWKSFRGFNESLTYVKMMIRRSRTV
ncbi:ficolin-1-like [Calliphora vicina]|uniref:ficolin-1-like n=1 Tax=Calliphora vicina TaxID=7373 RepID=UPI00325B94C8